MRATYLTLTIEASLLLIAMILIDARSLRRNLCLAALFFAAFYIDNLLITATSLFPALRLIPNHDWVGIVSANWSGKVYSILAGLSLVWLCKPRISLQEFGLRIKQNPGSALPAALLTALLGLGFLLSGLPFPRESFDVPILAYLALMPGLNEELVYRGVMLAAADRLFTPRWQVFGAQVGWGSLLTTLIFALLHGFWLDPALQPHFLAGRVLMSLFTGSIFVWLRARSGSLLFPILAHGAVDFFAYLGRMV